MSIPDITITNPKRFSVTGPVFDGYTDNTTEVVNASIDMTPDRLFEAVRLARMFLVQMPEGIGWHRVVEVKATDCLVVEYMAWFVSLCRPDLETVASCSRVVVTSTAKENQP